ncbi:MAG: 50S ribosomal protein L10 [Bacteroidales bacterium]|nr:50S ribosomal protein L10 [Bacteroidales bacterium]
MRKEEKTQLIQELTEQLNEYPVIYLTDILGLDVAKTNQLRRQCFGKNVKLRMVKNTLLKKALEQTDKADEELYSALTGSTAVMFSDTGNVPAKLIKNFRKSFDKPILKAAYIEETVYLGDDKIDALTAIKSKEELIADIVSLLQSPAKNVISGLQASGGQKVAGILKTLSEKSE